MAGQSQSPDEYYLSVEEVIALLQNKEYQRIDDMVQAMHTLAATVAHELRTPLAGIEQGLNGIAKLLPTLFEAYDAAVHAGLPVQRIRQHQRQALGEVIPAMQRQVTRSNIFIDMALMNLRNGGINPDEFSQLSMTHVVVTALERYPFQPGERELIRTHLDEDFIFAGNEIYTLHILYNLVKNALFFIHAENKGMIHITLERGEQWNKLYFKDTARGIAAEQIPHIFTRFYSKRDAGTGVGLAFCRMMMEAYSGHISCRAELGKFTEFILLFPVIEPQN